MAVSHTPLRPLWAAFGLLLALLTGCATTPQGGGAGDPLEPMNRQIYAFNDAFDRAIAKPVAKGYRQVTPDPVERSVGNFFDNLDDVSVLFNSLLQAKGRKAAITSLRLAVNSTLGVFGLFDFAGVLGMEKQNEDFGQTLGRWGIGTGPYVVLPILGPSSFRGTTGLVVDAQYEALDRLAEDDATYYSARILNAIHIRAGLLGATRMVDTAAVDPYAFTREAYLRRRANAVYDGNPPPEALPGRSGGQGEGEFDPFSNEDEDLFQDQNTSGEGGSAR